MTNFPPIALLFAATILAIAQVVSLLKPTSNFSSTFDPKKEANECTRKLNQFELFFDDKRKARHTSSYAGGGPKELFDRYEPEATCLTEERFGGDPGLPRHDAFGDGPKFVCGVDVLKGKNGDCLVYSVGSSNDIKFEQAVKKHMGCEIHTFDPTVSESSFVGHDTAVFHQWGFGSDGEPAEASDPARGNFSWTGKSLEIVVQDLGHSHRTIDILKIDCEGCEWQVLKDIFSSIKKRRVQIDQILVEMHYKTNKKGLETLFQHMDSAGLRLFHKERNQWGCDGWACVEYAMATSNFLRKVNTQILC